MLISNSHSNTCYTYILKNGPIKVCLHKTRIRRFPSRSLCTNFLTGITPNLLKLLHMTSRYTSHLIQRPDHLTNPYLVSAIPKSPANHRKTSEFSEEQTTNSSKSLNKLTLVNSEGRAGK